MVYPPEKKTLVSNDTLSIIPDFSLNSVRLHAQYLSIQSLELLLVYIGRYIIHSIAIVYKLYEFIRLLFQKVISFNFLQLGSPCQHPLKEGLQFHLFFFYRASVLSENPQS